MIVNCKLTVKEEIVSSSSHPCLSLALWQLLLIQERTFFPFKVVVPPRLPSHLPRNYLRARRNKRKLNYSIRMFEEKESNRSSMTMLITRPWFWVLHEQSKITKQFFLIVIPVQHWSDECRYVTWKDLEKTACQQILWFLLDSTSLIILTLLALNIIVNRMYEIISGLFIKS